MSELAWLSEYAGETTDELIALEGTFCVSSIVAAFHQALDQKAFRLGDVRQLSASERFLLAVIALENEINNGGYEQYFFNNPYELVGEIISALEHVGREDIAQLTRRAIEAESSSDTALEECNAEFFRIAADLPESLLNFIKRGRTGVSLP